MTMPSDSKQLVVAIEAGGTKCSVHLASRSGVLASHTGGPCNFTTLGLAKTLDRIRTTTESALSALPDGWKPSDTSLANAVEKKLFAGLTVGMAGVDRPTDVQRLRPALADMFGLDVEDEKALIVGNDAILLSLPLLKSKYQTGIALVAGTGSVAFLLRKNRAGIPEAVQRAGGYGPLLGDEGSGLHIGKLAIQSALSAFDAGKPFSPLHKAVFAHFKCTDEPGDLLNHVLEIDSTLFPGTTPNDRIAGTCRIVFELAERERAGLVGLGPLDEDTATVIIAAVEQLAVLADRFFRSPNNLRPEETMLILGGSVLNNNIYSKWLVATLEDDETYNLRFGAIEVVKDAGVAAARILAEQIFP